ncbi:MAG TPA: hypothetical protein VF038_08985 [Usitatibacter sp.]
MADAFRARHEERTASFTLELPLARAFELFTPRGEKAWAEGWDPEFLHPPDGTLVEGAVFRTRHGGEETLWMAMRCDRDAGEVDYLRATPGSRIATIHVRCTPLGAGRTSVAVRYAFTGLSEAGNEWIRAMDEPRYAQLIDSWRAAIEAALRAQ